MCNKQHLGNTKATSETQFMKKLSKTEVELKKSVAYVKVCTSQRRSSDSCKHLRWRSSQQ